MTLRNGIMRTGMLAAASMLLFPPWTVRQGSGNIVGPEHAAGYAFIASPPNKTRGNLTVESATVDLSRLLMQLCALGLLTAGTAALLGTRIQGNE